MSWSGSGSQRASGPDPLAALGVVPQRTWRDELRDFVVIALVALALAWFLVVGIVAEARRAAGPVAGCGMVGEPKGTGCDQYAAPSFVTR